MFAPPRSPLPFHFRDAPQPSKYAYPSMGVDNSFLRQSSPHAIQPTQRFAGEVSDLPLAAGGNLDGFRRDRGVVSRSVLLYVRTRGAEETGERREINPAARRYSSSSHSCVPPAPAARTDSFTAPIILYTSWGFRLLPFTVRSSSTVMPKRRSFSSR